MLAQNFKTPDALKITDAEFDGLLKTLGLLEREEIKHFPADGATAFAFDSEPLGFNMRHVSARTECGTAACMLGWARFLGGLRVFTGETRPELMDLFCMGGRSNHGKPLEDIQPSEAAIALRNYLTFGEPRWHEVFASE